MYCLDLLLLRTDTSSMSSFIADAEVEPFSSTTNHSNTANAKKARPTSSWIYETSLGKSIFEDTVIPAGAKRGGRS